MVVATFSPATVVISTREVTMAPDPRGRTLSTVTAAVSSSPATTGR